MDLNSHDFIEETKQLVDQAQEHVDERLSRTFPSFRLTAAIVSSSIYTGLVLFSILLDSFGLVEGINGVEKKALYHFIGFFLIGELAIPLLGINLFIKLYLKPVKEQYLAYFNTKKIENQDSYRKAVCRFDRFNSYMAVIILFFYLLGNSWGIEIGGNSGMSVLFYILSRISLVTVMIIFNVICINLFVRRRLLYVLDVYEIKSKLKFTQTQLFYNSVIPIVLILNVMFVFTDVTLRIVDTGQDRMEKIQEMALKITGGAHKISHEDTPLPPDGEGMPELSAHDLAKGYGILIFILICQTVLLYIFLGILQKRQMKDLHRKMADMADGSGDLTKQIKILEIDDLAVVISHFNQFIGNMREKLLTIENATSRVTHSSETLFDELQNTSAATEEMVASVEQINRTTGNRTSLVEQTGENLRSMIESLNQVKNSVDTQATFVEQTSSAINQMAASIQSVTQATGKANDLSNHLSDAASAGGKAVNDSIAAVKDVETSSEEVNNLVSTITKIASQTNMLAMNAAIEAAHAGDAGRGFAVVAEEVRNLAENSSNSAKLITDQIQQMVGVVNNGVQMSEKAGDALGRVLGDINQTTEVINGIALAMDEQNAGATEILNSITSLVEATQKIKKISQDEMDKNEDMQKSIDQIIQAFQEIRLATEEQTQGTKDMIQTVSQLQEVAQDNQDVVKILSEAFAGFKLS